MIAGIFSHARRMGMRSITGGSGKTTRFNIQPHIGTTKMADDDDNKFHRLHKPAPAPMKDQSDKGEKKQE
ncbi:hypothetical protein V5J26_002197 [Escherichia coli]|uniref:hypothetical protein n=1 Tax=Escherichia coli TaxID=562 RepID=UPI00135DA71B|nr:hypothetical protein [Escherichia coli]EHM8994628.1 hypothetical protein [Escherichia coli]EKR7153856.1 hypothetical protein [Escherichia coli]ELO7595644.1 hypothetical protein [Escherichia coli]ELT5358111.1 hypothetical protein [Escherichia coli]EME5285195.1 hypothetical protein [Escherichia coli]